MKGLYVGILLLAIVASIATYIIFQYQPKMYRAVGRFTYYYPTQSGQSSTNVPFTSEYLTKSIAESVKTREFLENLFASSKNLSYDPQIIEAPSKVLQAKVVSGSNVIDVSVVLADLQALKVISENYFEIVKSTPMMDAQGPKPEIEILDPMFIEREPYYPKPLQYALFAFAGVVLVGTMIIYVFASSEN